MPDQSPAEVLRAAAALMRERAQAVRSACHTDWGDRPWDTEDCAEFGCVCIVYQGEHKPWEEAQVPLIQYVADCETDAHATHIASWHPAMAAAVADWLEAEAADAEVFPLRFPQALEVARVYLRMENDSD